MKTIQRAVPHTDLRRAEADVAMQIKALFGRCPELAGFAVQDLAELPDDDEAGDVESGLVVTDVGLSAPVTREETDKVYHLISAALSDVLSERPEAIDILRGRTFARALH
jgi:hypothetical protein